MEVDEGFVVRPGEALQGLGLRDVRILLLGGRVWSVARLHGGLDPGLRVLLFAALHPLHNFCKRSLNF